MFIFRAVRDPDGTVADLRYVFLNEAAGRLLGQPIESVLGCGQIEVFPSVREVGIWGTYMRVLESGTAEVFDVPRFHDNGVEGSFRLAASRFGDGLLVSAHDTTDQVRAEKALAAESAILRATLDSLLDPHVRLGVVRDENGQISDFVFEDPNAAACEYNGLPYEELVGTRLLDLLPGHTATGLLELYRRVVETGEPLVLDDYLYPHEVLGGQERRFDIRAARIVGEGMSFTWRDVTDRYEAAEYGNRMAAVVEYSGDGIVSGTLDGVVTSWNPAAERMYGFTAEEVIGTSIGPGTPEQFFDQANEIVEQVKAGRVVQNVETERIRKDGTVLAVSITVSPIREADGLVVGISSIHRDLSEQREAVELSRSMIEASVDSMVSISPEGLITDANQATVRLTGVPRDKLIGTSFSDYFTEQDKAEKVYQTVLERGSVTDYPLTLRHQGKAEWLVEVQYNAAIYRGLSGDVRGVFATARDVSRQLQAQREIAEQQHRERARLEELEQFQRLTVGRELKMIELKKEIEYLRKYGPAGSKNPDEDFQT